MDSKKTIGQMNRSELVNTIQTLGAEQYARENSGVALPALPRPRELDDPATPRELRIAILDSYVSAVMERPAKTWDAGQRAAVLELTRLEAREYFGDVQR